MSQKTPTISFIRALVAKAESTAAAIKHTILAWPTIPSEHVVAVDAKINVVRDIYSLVQQGSYAGATSFVEAHRKISSVVTELEIFGAEIEALLSAEGSIVGGMLGA